MDSTIFMKLASGAKAVSPQAPYSSAEREMMTWKVEIMFGTVSLMPTYKIISSADLL